MSDYKVTADIDERKGVVTVVFGAEEYARLLVGDNPIHGVGAAVMAAVDLAEEETDE